MQGNFETDPKVYPISAVINGDSSLNGPTYDIIDMRTQGTIAVTKNTYKELLPVLDKLNTYLGDGTLEKEGTSLAEAATLMLLELNMPAPAASVEAPPVAPEENQVSERTQQVRAPASLAFVPPIEPLQKL